ncbi:MAG: hypothetical protein FJ146_03195 [Deltaproteobacteria bacterium]|nr:hypothetical protein [Deltaproteobacteria bacterium]
MATGTSNQLTTNLKHRVTDQAVKLLANSIYRQLQDEGCAAKDIISVSSQLIGLVTDELQRDDQPS